MKEKQKLYKVLIAGAGPAGTAPLVLAARTNKLEQLLNSKIAILNKGMQMGSGAIGKYVVNSDTNCVVFLTCLEGQTEGRVFESLVQANATRSLEKLRYTSAPLKLVAEFLDEIGQALQSTIDRHPTSQVFSRTEATSLHFLADGTIHTKAVTLFKDELTLQQEFCSKLVVLALGGKQVREKALNEKIVGDLSLTGQLSGKVLLSDFVLTQDGVDKINSLLQNTLSKKIVIIGGSNSAFSAAWTLLNKVKGVQFSEGDIKILHRSLVKLCYGSRDEALDDGYTDFSDEDICPITKRVYRLGGLRNDAKELYRQIRGWSKERQEKRVKLIAIKEGNTSLIEIKTLLDEADLIITAYGYDTNIIPIYDANGVEIKPLCNRRGPMIDDNGRVLAEDGKPIPNVFAIGLGAGFRYSEKLGGEKTFTGEINGTWIYQNTIGEIILNQILPPTKLEV
jgi:hypothetical protein